MPEYLAPGVYVEEVESGPKPIEGVSTSTSGMVGFTERGPENTPTLVTSFAGFQQLFGGYINHHRAGYTAATQANNLNVAALPYAAEGFFLNGGQRLYVSRVVSATASAAQLGLYGAPSGTAGTGTLNALANADDTSIVLNAPLTIAGGSWLLIDDGERGEFVQPNVAAATTGPIVLHAGLNFGHNTGKAVTRMQETAGAAVPADTTRTMPVGGSDLAVDDATMATLTAGQIIRIRSLDDPDQTQYVVVDANGARAIRGSFDYAFNTARVEMRTVTLAAIAADTARKVKAPAPAAAATEVQLDVYTGIVPGDILQIDGNSANQTEFVLVDAIRYQLPVNVPLVGGLRFPHTVNTQVTERSPLLTLQARSTGSWGNALRVTVTPGSALSTSVTAPFAVNAPFVNLVSTLGVEPGTRLKIARSGGSTTEQVVQRVDGNNVYFAGGLSGAGVARDDVVTTEEFNLLVEFVDSFGRVAQSESFPLLTLAPTHSQYVGRVLGRVGMEGGSSMLLAVKDDDAFDPVTGQPLPSANNRALPQAVVRGTRNGRTLYTAFWLQGGDDKINDISEATYYGTDSIDPAERTGLQSLKNVDEISIVAIPGITTQEVQERLIAHCEELRYRFAVLDSNDGDTMNGVQSQRSLYDTKYAALYYPWAVIGDSFDLARRATLAIPPSGHIVGLYARVDVERGVHKAPANEVLRNVRDLQAHLNKPEQDILNPRNINVLRDFRDINRGVRVWGERCLTTDSQWKYVNVRRLFIFVEKSIERGTQWVVFEPNDEPLWKRVYRSVTNFLTSVWRDGALQGSKPEEAFFVKVDRTTMTQDDIDNGRLIILVGIAPVKPAEFVIFRISQYTADAQNQG